MSDQQVRVRWLDGSPETSLPDGSGSKANLAVQLADAGWPLNTRCGQRGQCNGCTVRLVSGRFVGNDGTIWGAPASVQACQGRLASGEAALLEVPARSRAVHKPQVVSTFKVNVPSAQDPIVPYREGKTSHGLAIDIGTTTVVVALVDLKTGRICREVSGFNRQIEMGDNVLTRIQQAGKPAGLEALRRLIVESTLQPMLQEIFRAERVDPRRLGAATVAGNTTMLHLLTGTDPSPMGVAPFRAPFLEHRILSCEELGLAGAPPTVPVHLLPGFSAYVGADLVAGSVCTGLADETAPGILVDIGTNGELVLSANNRLLATATAAGPAFEGGRLTCGTRAVAGAIQHVAFDRQGRLPRVESIPGAVQTVGLCGSAYVDLLAAGRRVGLIGPQGRLDAAAWNALPAEYRYENDGARGLRLQPGDPHAVVTEGDIAHLMQAKAAVAAGLIALLRRAGISPAAVGKLHLAGGFGLHLDVPNAIACGLLPGFSPAQVEVVGNTSLGGAWLALVDSGILPTMTKIAAEAELVELNLEPGFEDTYIDQLALP